VLAVTYRAYATSQVIICALMTVTTAAAAAAAETASYYNSGCNKNVKNSSNN